MSRIGRRILLPVAAAILGITLASLLLNTYFVGQALLSQQRKTLDRVAALLDESPHGYAAPGREALEQEFGVTIVSFAFEPDEERFNMLLRRQLQERGIGFLRLWLWKDNFERLQERGSHTQLYDQGRLHYSILARYRLDGGRATVIVMNIPHSAQTLRAVNRVTVAVSCAGGALLLLFTSLAVRRVTRPVASLTQLADELSQRQFGRVAVQGRDEIAALAAAFNRMSASLQAAQQELELKNRAMEELLTNVSHEIKTPVALIEAYGNGLRDGMDDGTFLEVILQQAERINRMAGSLLDLSRIRCEKPDRAPLNLSALVEETAASCMPLSGGGLSWELAVEPEVWICAGKEQMASVLENLITNAAKYGVGSVRLSLENEDTGPVFCIANGLAPGSTLDIERIWEPFYVGEPSRNKSLSGTGIGLARVRAILQQHRYTAECRREQGELRFVIHFREEPDCDLDVDIHRPT